MTHADLITFNRFVARLPATFGRVPRMLRGLYYTAIRNREKSLSLGWALERAARLYPDNPAVLDGQRRISYALFNGWANRLARAFKAEGVGHGSVVAVMLENRVELLAILAALAKLGAIGALVNTTQRGKVLVHSLNLVKPGHFVVGEELREVFEEVRQEVLGNAGHCYWVDDGDTLGDPGSPPMGWRNLMRLAQGQTSENLEDTGRVRLKDSCFYIYTSGTTGLPKASIMSHGKWIKAYGGFGHSGLGLGRDDVLYLTLPCYHNNAVTVCWSAALAGGAAMALRRKFSASGFWKDVQHYRATCFGYIGELCRYLLNQPPCAEERGNSLTCMIGNGLRPSIWAEFKQRFEIQRITEFYASSEGNIGFTNVFNFDNTVGFSPATYAIVRYDLENDHPVRDAKGFMEKVGKGEVGLLISEISAKWPFDGYTDPAKSEAVILRDVFKKGDAWFNTGDLMRDIGFKHTQFVDRLGDTFRWKGENVSTTEVENALGAFDGVEDAVVYGVEIPGTNGRCGMAALRLADGVELDRDALAAHLDRELPAYATPVFLRLLREVETTGTFKYKKTDLKRDAYDPARSATNSSSGCPAAPATSRWTRSCTRRCRSSATASEHRGGLLAELELQLGPFQGPRHAQFAVAIEQLAVEAEVAVVLFLEHRRQQRLGLMGLFRAGRRHLLHQFLRQAQVQLGARQRLAYLGVETSGGSALRRRRLVLGDRPAGRLRRRSRRLRLGRRLGFGNLLRGWRDLLRSCFRRGRHGRRWLRSCRLHWLGRGALLLRRCFRGFLFRCLGAVIAGRQEATEKNNDANSAKTFHSHAGMANCGNADGRLQPRQGVTIVILALSLLFAPCLTCHARITA